MRCVKHVLTKYTKVITMTLNKRINYFTELFNLLQLTNSKLEKQEIVNSIPDEVKDDFQYIIECLAGKHKFGYKYRRVPYLENEAINDTFTVKDVLKVLQLPIEQGNLCDYFVDKCISYTTKWYSFFEPIVNRTLKLGIGNSLIEKTDLSPMLAKKVSDVKCLPEDFYVTEKLDGNRCIAHYEDGQWIFTSRNGKTMYVDFDMSDLPTEYIYDGEVLSPEQVEMSKAIAKYVYTGEKPDKKFGDMFNSTSGAINTHDKNKNLVYNIFDIVDTHKTYEDRRQILDNLRLTSKDLRLTSDNVRILPVLRHISDVENPYDTVLDLLDKVTSIGGEGIMINTTNAVYQHKRTSDLLKLKKVFTMDLKVLEVMEGSGKYEDMVGALHCTLQADDGKIVDAFVGSGLSDEQRMRWWQHPDEIIGKIVEVAYFSLSQDARLKGTNYYSLRFPRLKKVRDDKSTTSEY